MRSNGNRFYLMALVFVLMLSMTFSGHADSSYISIQEMKDNVPSTWTENMKGGKKNFDCSIDASIVVPEVEQLPVLLVTYPGKALELDKTGYHVVDNSERGIMVRSVPDKELADVDLSQQIVMREDSLDEESIQQAESKAKEIINNVWNVDGMGIERLGITVYQTGNSMYKQTVAFFCPTYNGIAYLACPCSVDVIKGCAIPPYNTISIFWRDDIDYEGANIYIPKLIGEYIQDVPLLPFSYIQDVIRQRIQEGYVQSICEIRLGYICGNDPKHPGENFYLTPAWVVCGQINPYPNIPFYPDSYHEESRYASSLVINAQTGEIVDVTSRNKETFDAHILTWDDVR